MRTSLVSEFRNPHGVLHAFEVGRAHIGFGHLCAALSQVPGVKFPERQDSAWYPRPARFTYKGHDYAVAIPFADYWVGPVEPEAVYPETEELLAFLKRNVLRTRLMTRLRSHYVTE